MSKQEYNAVLQDWQVFRRGTTTILLGNVYGDDKNRFQDGDGIRTSNVTSPAPFIEGNIVQTRNTRYLLGKRAGEAFDDGHIVRNSTEDQIGSLRGYMAARGYNMVYTDSSVFFRLADPKARTPFNQVSFSTAVRMHNQAAPFSAVVDGALRFFDSAKDMRKFRKVKKVKLQVTGNRIIVQSHKVTLVEQPPMPDFAAELIAYQQRPAEQRSVVEALLDSL